MPDITSDAWTQIRYEYEHTDRPIEDICAEHGISSGTLRDRMRRWRWTRRRAPISCEGPPTLPGPERDMAPQAERIGVLATPTPTRTLPLSAGGSADAVPRSQGESPAHLPHIAENADTSEPAQSDPASIAERLQGAVVRVLPAIEATVAKLAAGPQRPREMEQTARALGTLMRTLRELNALLSQQPLRAGTGGHDDMPEDDLPEDMDAFRNELARRIDAFVASRSDAG
jgi:hypothetical protein